MFCLVKLSGRRSCIISDKLFPLSSSRCQHADVKEKLDGKCRSTQLPVRRVERKVPDETVFAAATVDDSEKFPSKIGSTTWTQKIATAVRRTKFFETYSKTFKAKKVTGRATAVEFQQPDVESSFRDVEEARDKGNALRLEHADESVLWQECRPDRSKLGRHYLGLSKFRLTMLVATTSAAGYGLAPSPAFDPVTLLVSTAGVGLTSAAANAINQYLEVPFDSQMNRTKNRVLVRGNVSPGHAVGFALTTGAAGTLVLYNLVNPLAAALAVANLVLYTSVYTPMKRVSIANTWVGSVVGAIPPLIGWASATGSLDAGAAVLGLVLYTWQFPHFNSLSWNLRPDYSKAGYRMMSVTHPDLCKRVALRHSIGCLLVCSVAAPLLDVTTLAFAVDSMPLNLYLVFLAWKFRQRADSSSSRKLFRYTLVHLPLLMLLMFVSRKSGEPAQKKNILRP